ncbi:hypothetical protein [Aquiflexum sp.]|uniref:hypothetical protein n=1 Tax=Aquiflexum sp. TaxID=1872584 RepID=UPI003593409A
MNIKNSFKSLIACLALPWLNSAKISVKDDSEFDWLLNPLPPMFHLVAVGSAASEWATHYHKYYPFESVTLISDLEPKEKDGEMDFIQFSPFEEDKFEMLERNLINQLEIPTDIFQQLKSKIGSIFLVSALGNYTGTVISQRIAERFHLGPFNDKFKVLLTLPFWMEGEKKRCFAQQVADYIVAERIGCVCDLEYMRRIHGNVDITTLFKLADNWMLDVMLSELPPYDKKV